MKYKSFGALSEIADPNRHDTSLQLPAYHVVQIHRAGGALCP
jgi:hypothetical protein